MTHIELPAHYPSLNEKTRWQVREKYIIKQKGLCYFCKQSLDGPPSRDITKAYIKEQLFPPGFFTRPIHLHHDHSTGMTIGTVHARCNAYLWQYKGE